MLISSSPEAQEVESSLDPGKSVLMTGLMQRVRQFGQANRQVQEQIVEAPEEGDDLQEVLNQVAGQVPDDDESPDDDSSSSTSSGEKCGVCSRSLRNRPIAKCAGCTKRVHKDYCVNYMRMSTNLRAGMCSMCCEKVENWFTEIRVYATTSG